jgi:hypothetical protein
LRHFVSKIIVDYVRLLGTKIPRKIAFDFNDSSVLVWAEIANDDEAQEREIILAEAKINAKYHDAGFTVDTTVVEERDGLSVPNHFVPLFAL